MSDAARRAEIAEFRAQVDAELVAMIGATAAAEMMKTIDENSDGMFFADVLTGWNEVGDPYGEHPVLARALLNVLQARNNDRAEARSGRMGSAADKREARSVKVQRRNVELRKLQSRMQKKPPGDGPVSAERVRLRLQTHAADRAEVLGPDATPADVPKVQTISRALRK